MLTRTIGFPVRRQCLFLSVKKIPFDKPMLGLHFMHGRYPSCVRQSISDPGATPTNDGPEAEWIQIQEPESGATPRPRAADGQWEGRRLARHWSPEQAWTLSGAALPAAAFDRRRAPHVPAARTPVLRVYLKPITNELHFITLRNICKFCNKKSFYIRRWPSG